MSPVFGIFSLAQGKYVFYRPNRNSAYNNLDTCYRLVVSLGKMSLDGLEPKQYYEVAMRMVSQ